MSNWLDCVGPTYWLSVLVEMEDNIIVDVETSKFTKSRSDMETVFVEDIKNIFDSEKLTFEHPLTIIEKIYKDITNSPEKLQDGEFKKVIDKDIVLYLQKLTLECLKNKTNYYIHIPSKELKLKFIHKQLKQTLIILYKNKIYHSKLDRIYDMDYGKNK